MRLIPNSRAVALRSHSVRFGAAAFIFELFGVIGNVWGYFEGLLPISPLTFAIIGLLLGLIGLAGRFVDQDL
jgi:hypothetical protein